MKEEEEEVEVIDWDEFKEGIDQTKKPKTDFSLDDLERTLETLDRIVEKTPNIQKAMKDLLGGWLNDK